MENEVKLNEVEVQKLDLKPGEVLVVKLKSDDITSASLESLSNGLKGFFPNNKVVVLAVEASGSIDLTVAKGSEYTENSCGPTYCTDCSCGKGSSGR